jgi:hypothetical protein
MCVSLLCITTDDVHVKLVTVTVYTLDHRSSYTSVTNPATEITPRRLITEQSGCAASLAMFGFRRKTVNLSLSVLLNRGRELAAQGQGLFSYD